MGDPMLNKWSCLPEAFAMAMDMSAEELIQAIGDDGSEIIWPDLPDPYCRRGFHPQQIIPIALTRGFAIVEFQSDVRAYNGRAMQEIKFPSPDIQTLLSQYKGVIVGDFRGKSHAVYWDGSQIHDPRGMSYMFHDSISIRQFYGVCKVLKSNHSQ
jgi:hypothetical protein